MSYRSAPTIRRAYREVHLGRFKHRLQFLHKGADKLTEQLRLVVGPDGEVNVETEALLIQRLCYKPVMCDPKRSGFCQERKATMSSD